MPWAKAGGGAQHALVHTAAGNAPQGVACGTLLFWSQGACAVGPLAQNAQTAVRRVGEVDFAAQFLTQLLADVFHHRVVAARVKQHIVQFSGHLLHRGVPFGQGIGSAWILARGQPPSDPKPRQPAGCQKLLFVALQHNAQTCGGGVGHGMYRPHMLCRQIAKKL